MLTPARPSSCTGQQMLCSSPVGGHVHRQALLLQGQQLMALVLPGQAPSHQAQLGTSAEYQPLRRWACKQTSASGSGSSACPITITEGWQSKFAHKIWTCCTASPQMPAGVMSVTLQCVFWLVQSNGNQCTDVPSRPQCATCLQPHCSAQSLQQNQHLSTAVQHPVL